MSWKDWIDTAQWGKCEELMPRLPDECVHGIITDPPYGLKFMGKEWDRGVPGIPFWLEALRVAMPGAYLLAFGGTRMFHRLMCAIEDAGWEIRDTIMWVYGSGFPKSHDVSKAIDKAAGVKREVIGKSPNWRPAKTHGGAGFDKLGTGEAKINITAPITEAAKHWQGYGTNLKPAWEPIVVARKPLEGTVAENVLKYGTGAMNIDAARIKTADQQRDADVYRHLSSLYFDVCSHAVAGERLRSLLRYIVSALRSCNIDGKVHSHNEVDLGDTPTDRVLCELLISRLYPNGVWCGGSSWLVPDSLAGCPSCRRSCDEHIRPLQEAAQASAASLSDALERICSSQLAPEHTRECQCSDRPSSSDDFLLALCCSFVLGSYYNIRLSPPQSQGRFPANLILDGSEEVVRGFPSPHGAGKKRNGGLSKDGTSIFCGNWSGNGMRFGDSGSAARFFYCAKASKAERNKGLDNTYTVKYNIPKGGILCKDASMVLVESLKRATSGLELTWLIGESGASIMGLCPRATLSITLTAISKITTSQILNSLMPLLTNASIRDVNCEKGNGGSLVESVGSLSELKPTTINANRESVRGVELVVSQMLFTISDGANWKPLTNTHATVKPLKLMEYLVKLISRDDQIILDMFAGSGSTLVACKKLGRRFIGFEINEEDVLTCNKRLKYAQRLNQEVFVMEN